MKDFMRILRDADEKESSGASSVAEITSNAFNNMDDAPEPKDEPPPAAPAKENEPGEVKEEPKNEDPDIEMEFEEEEGKGKAKYKMSQVKAAMKELFENRQAFGGAKALQRAIRENPTFGKLYSTLVNKTFQDGKFDEEFATKTLASLEAKAEQTEQQVEKVEDHISEMQKDLEELDPESPQYRVLSKNIAQAKQMSAQLRETQAQNKAMQEKLDKVVKFQDDSVQSSKKADVDKQVERLSGVFNTEIGALTDASKPDGFKFVNEGIAKRFDKDVREAVAARSVSIKTDADFVKAIKEEATRLYKDYTAEGEAYVNDYLKKKGGLPTKAPEIKKEEPKEPMDAQAMGNALADAMLGS